MFHKLALQDKQRFEAQMAERENKGYFMLSNGTKSIDEENEKLFKVRSQVSDDQNV